MSSLTKYVRWVTARIASLRTPRGSTLLAEFFAYVDRRQAPPRAWPDQWTLGRYTDPLHLAWTTCGDGALMMRVLELADHPAARPNGRLHRTWFDRLRGWPPYYEILEVVPTPPPIDVVLAAAGLSGDAPSRDR